MKHHLKWFVAILCFVTGTAFSAGAEAPADQKRFARSNDSVIHIARIAMAEGDWVGVQGFLKDALQENPNNADYHNLYAYALRKGPNPDMTVVLAEYAEALRLDPRHRGAHEYMGEAYLQLKNPAKAKELLASLDRLCFFGCKEYTELKAAIEKYEATNGEFLGGY